MDDVIGNMSALNIFSLPSFPCGRHEGSLSLEDCVVSDYLLSVKLSLFSDKLFCKIVSHLLKWDVAR